MNIKQIIDTSVVWDNHACMPLRPQDHSFLPQLERHRNSGYTVVVLNIGFDPVAVDPLAAFRVVSSFRKWIKEHSDKYHLVNSIEDIDYCKASGKLGVCFDIEGGSVLQESIELVSLFYDLGVRWMLIAYNHNNSLGGGCQDSDTGLTDFGRWVIDEMERVGMVLCCSHSGYTTALEAMEYSNNPVIFSHSNPRAVNDHERNIPDELIVACAKTGGVINLNGVGVFLGENDISTSRFIKHVNYVADLVGPEHVGMGMDYLFDPNELTEYQAAHPEIFPPEKGYVDSMPVVPPEALYDIADALVQSGWNETQLRGFLGENNLRIAKRVWR